LSTAEQLQITVNKSKYDFIYTKARLSQVLIGDSTPDGYVHDVVVS